MKKTFTLISLFLSLSLSPVKADYWVQKADFGALSGRQWPIAFTIGAKTYAGTGWSSIGDRDDIWEYDQAANTWTQKANFGGGNIEGASCFTDGTSGYVVFGLSSGNYLNELWEYEPVANTWAQKTSCPGPQRYVAVATSINGKGYAGLGYAGGTNYYSDWYEYDPVTDTWTPLNPFPGGGRDVNVAFTINSKVYAGTGYDGNFFYNDFWEFDPSSNTWSQMASVPGTNRHNASGFSIGNKGYIGIGSPNLSSGFLNDFYEYDPIINSWLPVAVFSGSPRRSAAGFNIGNKGYILCGQDISGYSFELWEYTPDSTTSVEEIPPDTYQDQFSIAPNPAKDYLVISSEFEAKEKINVTITDAQGKKVFETQLETKTLNLKLKTLNYSKGIYFVEVNDGKEKTVKKFVKD